MKKLLLILFTLSFVACFPPNEVVLLRSYVMRYVDVEDISISATYKEAVEYPDNLVMGVHWTRGGIIGSYNSRKHAYDVKYAYDALCEKHGDVTYDRTVRIYNNTPIPTFPAVDFVSIEVTSDADYDAEHPAGTSLNDLITAKFDSAKPYIDSGYKEYDEVIGVGSLIRYSVMTQNLADVSADDLVLLGNGNGYWRTLIKLLVFEREPTLSKTHTFTVTMTADDGRVFSDSIEITFD